MPLGCLFNLPKSEHNENKSKCKGFQKIRTKWPSVFEYCFCMHGVCVSVNTPAVVMRRYLVPSTKILWHPWLLTLVLGEPNSESHTCIESVFTHWAISPAPARLFSTRSAARCLWSAHTCFFSMPAFSVLLNVVYCSGTFVPEIRLLWLSWGADINQHAVSHFVTLQSCVFPARLHYALTAPLHKTLYSVLFPWFFLEKVVQLSCRSLHVMIYFLDNSCIQSHPLISEMIAGHGRFF